MAKSFQISTVQRYGDSMNCAILKNWVFLGSFFLMTFKTD